MRSGWAYTKTDHGYISASGAYGAYWSPVAKFTTMPEAYSLGLDPDILNPSSYSERLVGFPLRCLVVGKV